MNAMHQDNTNQGATKTSAVEDEMRELIRRQIAPTVSKPPAETSAAQEFSPPLVPTIAASGAGTIEAIERLIGELQETRDYLKTEAERIARASARYAQMSQSASASVLIISETLQQWRKGGG
jgi:hypothetical protein